MFTFAQDCYPDVELVVTVTSDDAMPIHVQEERIRCHRCVLVTNFEWFRAWLAHPNTLPVNAADKNTLPQYRISTDGLQFTPLTVRAMIEQLYNKEGTNVQNFIEAILAANMYFGRTGPWLKTLLSDLVRSSALGPNKLTFRVLRALSSVQGLSPEPLVRSFWERYAGILPPELAARLLPFGSLTNVDTFTGQAPRATSAVDDRHARIVLVLEGSQLDQDDPTLQWNGLEYRSFITEQDEEVGIWLTARPIGEELSSEKCDSQGIRRKINGMIHSVLHCVKVRLRLFHGLRPGGQYFSAPGEFIRSDGTDRTVRQRNQMEESWQKADFCNFVFPIPIRDRSYSLPERGRVGTIVNDSRCLTGLAYRFEVIVFDTCIQ